MCLSAKCDEANALSRSQTRQNEHDVCLSQVALAKVANLSLLPFCRRAPSQVHAKTANVSLLLFCLGYHPRTPKCNTSSMAIWQVAVALAQVALAQVALAQVALAQVTPWGACEGSPPATHTWLCMGRGACMRTYIPVVCSRMLPIWLLYSVCVSYLFPNCFLECVRRSCIVS